MHLWVINKSAEDRGHFSPPWEWPAAHTALEKVKSGEFKRGGKQFVCYRLPIKSVTIALHYMCEL